MNPILKPKLILTVLLITTWWSNVQSYKEKRNGGFQVNMQLPKRNQKPKYGVGVERVNWYEAEESCRQYNMRLVTIKGKLATERIIETIEEAKGRRNIGGSQFWTSGNDLAERGKFYWLSTGEEVSRYTNWLRQEPTREERSYKNWQTSPHCIFMKQYKSRKYYWDYSPCTQKKYFVCERFNKKWHTD